MPVTKTVNKTLVNGSEVFIYTFNISFSELTQPALSGKLVDFFPDKITYQLPNVGGQLKSIDEIPVAGGKQVVFNFGNVNAGTSISYTLSSQFSAGRVDTDSFTNTADLYADELVIDTATAPTVNLVLDENFSLSKTPYIYAPVVAGEDILFKLKLNNTNDPGAKITNISIQDILPPQLIANQSFTPIGNDNSTGGYNDTTYDGLTGSWTGNTLNFTLPSFSGSSYVIEFKATVAPNVIPGELITNIATWTVDSIARPEAKTRLTVFEDKASLILFKYAPKYGTIGEPIQYSMFAGNTGTVDLTNYVLTDTLPAEVDITSISFYPAINLSSYDLLIETSDDSGFYKIVATGITGDSGLYDLTPLIPVGERVLSVRTIIDNYKVGVSTSTFNLAGTINNTATQDQMITNIATVSADSSFGTINGSNTGITELNGKSVLKIRKFLNPTLPAYYPLNEFMILQSASADNGQIVDPIFSDLLPLGLDYAPGNHYFSFYDNMTRTRYYSYDAGFPIPSPTPEIIKNYQGTGRTLVRFDFTGFTLLFKNKLNANFTAIVTLNPPNTFENFSYLGNRGDNAEVEGTEYLDVNDLDGDGITAENIAQSRAVNGVILTTSEFSIEKWVKGDLSDIFTKASTVTPGGDVKYELNITNNQDIQLKNIEIVDILPYVGDTGVILNTTPRGSEFDVYATSVASAEIINILGEPVTPAPIITIEYSTSNDPIRFDQTGSGTIGTGTWSITPPTDITSLSSIRIITDPSTILKPYERLNVVINAKSPVDTPVNKLAYNSFAVQADKIINGTVEPMLPVEPNKVSIETKPNDLASIGDFVWDDANNNGIHDTGELGVNGVVAELYDANKNLITTTITAFNGANKAGYYSFNNLLAGDYFVKFIPPIDYELTIQKSGEVNGSKPDSTTGFTNIITIARNENITDIDAGILSTKCTEPPIIQAYDKCLCVGDLFAPLANVFATDCDDSDIPLTGANVIENNVDTAVPGSYTVTYQVTSPINGLVTEKTITVKVCEKTPRAQAISDIFMSVALGQTALAHILNAEAEKIDKAEEIKASSSEMIDINNSVSEMVRSISTMEMLLQRKLGLFSDCDPCGNNCCLDIEE